jgi:hypothetical protein
MESIFDEIDKDRIAPQEFSLAIFIGIIYFVLSYAYIAFDKDTREISIAINTVFGIILLTFLKNYIKNFNRPAAEKWVKLKIGANIITFLILICLCIYNDNRHPQVVTPNRQYKGYFIAILYFLTSLFDLLVSILFGLELMKIKNDSIGLLRQLGKLIAYYLPVAYFIILGLMFYTPFRIIYISENRPLFMALIISNFIKHICAKKRKRCLLKFYAF